MRRFSLVLAFGLAVSIRLPAQIQYEHTAYPFNQVSGVVIADFDRDGLPDMAAAAPNGVSVARNIGNGHFGAGVFYSVPAGGSALAVDVNGDGWPDIVNWNNQGVSILLNNKNGTFRAGAQFATAKTTWNVAAADFNVDGRVDLVAVEDGQLQVFKGTGTGTFTAGQIVSAPGIAEFFYLGKVEIEDYNQDGKLDIAGVTNDALQIWWGNGDGTFRAGTSINSPDGLPLVSLAMGDFNNDGIPDLAIAAARGCPTDPNHLCGTNQVYVYRNNGKGTMSRVSSFTLGSVSGGTLYAEDVNGDQNVDLVVTDGDINVGNFNYALGKGNGTFGADVFLTELDDQFVAFRDLNLDSRHDFIFPDTISNEEMVFLALDGYTNCAPPDSATLSAKVCTPADDALTGTSVLVAGSGNSPLGVKRMEIWIDGVKRFQRFEDQIAQRFTLAPGSHRIAVVAVDQYLGYSKTARMITVR